MINKYFELITNIEHINRSFLNVLKNELDFMGVKDLSAIEALLIYNIGEDPKPIVRLCVGGYYIGTNFSYSIKKLLQHRYIIKEEHPKVKSQKGLNEIKPYDTRRKYIKLSEKGMEMFIAIDSIILSQAEDLLSVGIDDKRIDNTNNILEKLEKTLSSSKRT